MKKLIIIILLLLLTACKGSLSVERIIEVPIEVVKTEYVNSVLYDSIYIHDSINIHQKGDTVYLTKIQDLVRYKLKKDTVLLHDTIPKIVTVSNNIERVVEVNKLTSWQQAFIKLGEIMLIVLLGILLYLIYNLYKIIKK